MGIASPSSSSTESNTGNNQAPPEKRDWPEAMKAALRQVTYALIPTKLEREKESEARHCEWRGGPCEELFTALRDCPEEPGHKFLLLVWKVNNCMYTHHRDYQPQIAEMEEYWRQVFSSTESDTRNNQVPPGKPGEPPDDWPEPMKAALRKHDRELDALFPPELGESATEEEREKASDARWCEFMRGGACAQVFTAHQDCKEGSGHSSNKCQELGFKLNNCMYSHHRYYQPYLSLHESFIEEGIKHFDALTAARRRKQS